MIRGAALTGSIVVALLSAGCGGAASPTDDHVVIAPDKDAITKTTENGPVKATVKVWPAKPTLNDPVYVQLEIESPPGVQIKAPYQEAGDSRLGRFHIESFVHDTQRADSGGVREQQTYALEAPTSGRQRIPPLRIEMIDSRTSAPAAPASSSTGSGSGASPSIAGKAQELLTEEIPIEIAPVPAEQATAALKPALGDLDPDVGKTSWLTILGLASIAMVAGSGTILAIRALRARRRIQAQRSAYEEAVAELRALEQRGAPGADDADAWFVRLSAIVRRYLEYRYDIRAPELTTEEFLQVATARPELTAEHRALLSGFLERCDRVKFAGYRPDADESIATLASARGFVEDTRLRESTEGIAA